MFFAPAAMFAMFFYLSQYIQIVMGYSPIRAGVAFLPFCFGLVAAAGISSNLVNRIDPRYPGRHRHPDGRRGAVRVLPAALRHHRSRCSDVQGSYVTDLLPFILLMSFGMGLTFVPLTLTAVHHLRDEDSGIGSGVLNTMQQVGGALGPVAARRPWPPRRSTTGHVLEPPKAGCRWPAIAASSRRAVVASTRCSPRARPTRSCWPPGLMMVGLAGDLDLPQRQARGAGDRRPGGPVADGVRASERRRGRRRARGQPARR